MAVSTAFQYLIKSSTRGTSASLSGFTGLLGQNVSGSVRCGSQRKIAGDRACSTGAWPGQQGWRKSRAARGDLGTSIKCFRARPGHCALCQAVEGGEPRRKRHPAGFQGASRKSDIGIYKAL